MKMPMISAVALVMLISGCENTMTQATATEGALCEEWGGSMPKRSRDDTDQTRYEIQWAYAVFAAACPEHKGLVP